MANSPTAIKRQKERNRQDKQREKEEKRKQRRMEKTRLPDKEGAEADDPDIAGIVPGPQPVQE